MTIYDIYFNSDHDMELSGSDIHFASEDDIVKQSLTIRLQFLFNEWFLNTLVGMPYTQTIFEQGTSIDDIYNIFRKEVLDTDGVDSIQKLELTPDAGNKGLLIELEVNDNIHVEVTI